MKRRNAAKRAWLIGGVLLVGAAVAAARRALKPADDYDPWGDDSWAI